MMKKLYSLIKASLSEGMSLFKLKQIDKQSNIRKKLFPVFLFLIVMYGIGTYAYLIAKPLSKIGLTHIMLSMMIMFVSIYTIIEGFYKAQGMLFDCKDNDMLLSMPLNKKTIFFVRMFKFYLFQLMYDSLFILPAFIIYAYFESPGINFYLMSLVMLILLPIIPLIVASFIGYIIKLISVNFKKSKNVQTIISMLLLISIFYFSFNMESLVNNIVNKANVINDVITKIYYPINLYLSLINKFDVLKLLKLILINIVPFIIFIYLGSIYYFKIIFKSKKSDIKKSNRALTFKRKNVIFSLTKKEMKTYFGIPVYIVNTLFGMVLMIILTILLCTNVDKFISLLQSSSDIVITLNLINKYAPIFFMEMILFTGFMTQITCSSISLEGKTFNILKSYPINEKKIFISKVLFSLFLTIPIILLCSLIFLINYKVKSIYIIYILLFSFLTPLFSALLGLFINLKYPKLKWNNETEVVKQSTSTMICTFTGMGLFFISLFITIKFINNINIVMLIQIIILIITNIILWLLLSTVGVKEFRKLNY